LAKGLFFSPKMTQKRLDYKTVDLILILIYATTAPISTVTYTNAMLQIPILGLDLLLPYGYSNQLKSFIHSILVTLTSLYLFFIEPVGNVLFGTNAISSTLALCSGTFYLGDIVELLRLPFQFHCRIIPQTGKRIVIDDIMTKKDIVMVIHHLVCSMAFLLGYYYNFMHKPIHAILLYEASTIFLKLRWYVQQYEEGVAKKYYKRVIEWIFTFLFVGIRIVYGFCYVTPLILSNSMYIFTSETSVHPLHTDMKTMKLLSICASGLVMMSNLLNIVFLFGIISMLGR
jgi:hypothetical protein